MDLPTLHTILLPKSPSKNLQNALSTSGILHSTASDQGTKFTAKEVLTAWNSLVLLCPHHS